MRRVGRLTLIDLIAAVGATALALAWLKSVAPGRSGPALIVIGPLVGIVFHRWRGGRGVIGGTVGGAAYAGIVMLDFFTGPHGPHRPGPSTMANWPAQLLIMTTICLVFGTTMGLTTWLWAAAMGRARAPAPSEPLVRCGGRMQEDPSQVPTMKNGGSFS